jgi:hypothetical protein
MPGPAPSTAPLVVKQLVTNLQGAAGLADVQVLYGDTAQAERSNVIITGDVEWEDEVWAAEGGRKREETYLLDGYCQVRDPGHTQQEALEACFALVATIESTLRSMIQPGMGFSLGPTNGQVTNLEFRPKKGMGFPSGEGRAYQIDFHMRVTARI